MLFDESDDWVLISPMYLIIMSSHRSTGSSTHEKEVLVPMHQVLLGSRAASLIHDLSNRPRERGGGGVLVQYLINNQPQYFLLFSCGFPQ
jgi:hypothetical protein